MTLTSSNKGILLAVANVFTVALCTAVAIRNPASLSWMHRGYRGTLDVFAIVAVNSMLPAILVGAMLGRLGGSLLARRRARLVILTIAASACVALFGVVSDWYVLIPFAALPTLGWTSVLERWTRPSSPLPLAYRIRLR